jgi:hypothetical protein
MKIASPVMLAIGICGNLANLYAFTRQSMTQYSTFRFLAYLSVSDIVVLLIGKSHIIFMSFSSHDFRDHSHAACALHSFLTIFSTHVSTNLLAAVSVDRVFSMNKIKQNTQRQIKMSFVKKKSKSKAPKVATAKATGATACRTATPSPASAYRHRAACAAPSRTPRSCSASSSASFSS